MLSFITWTLDPDLFHIGSLTVRWYGLMWALGFFLGYMVESRIYRNEKLPEECMEKLFLYMLVGTILGARIGHCFFYDWAYYSQHPLKILFIWEGGLSSHGGAFGILIALWIFHKKVVKKSYLWVLDRVVIAVAICGACIRLGNLMNHEIYGHPTNLPWAFRFITNIHEWQNGAAPVFSPPSHPTQIYEMLYCLITFGVLLYMYWKTKAPQKEGLIFGVFLIGIFLTRFLLEFIKENQVGFENGMILNMGQLLSIPFFLLGFYLILRKSPQPPVGKLKKS